MRCVSSLSSDVSVGLPFSTRADRVEAEVDVPQGQSRGTVLSAFSASAPRLEARPSAGSVAAVGEGDGQSRQNAGMHRRLEGFMCPSRRGSKDLRPAMGVRVLGLSGLLKGDRWFCSRGASS